MVHVGFAPKLLHHFWSCLRTFLVLCCDPESGLICWVGNTNSNTSFDRSSGCLQLQWLKQDPFLFRDGLVFLGAGGHWEGTRILWSKEVGVLKPSSSSSSSSLSFSSDDGVVLDAESSCLGTVTLQICWFSSLSWLLSFVVCEYLELELLERFSMFFSLWNSNMDLFRISKSLSLWSLVRNSGFDIFKSVWCSLLKCMKWS